MDLWIVYAILAALVWGVEYSFAEKILERTSARLVFVWISAFQLCICLIYSLLSRKSLNPMPLLQKEVRLHTFVCCFTSLIAGLLIAMSIKASKNATVSSMIEISYPFFVALVSWLVFGQNKMTFWTWIGGFFISLGIFFIMKSK